MSQPSVLERYTEATRRAIESARQEALHQGASAITVEDLLAGLSVEENSRAERVGSLKANASYLRWLAGLPPLPSPAPAPQVASTRTPVGLDLEAKRAIAFAVLEADRDRSYWIDSDHLFRGLLRFPNKAHFAVLKLEINLASARRASRLDREEYPPEENPNIKVMQYLARKYFTLLAPPVLSLACYLYILFEGFGMFSSPLAR